MHVITGLSTGGAETMLFKLLSATTRDWDPAVVSLMSEGSIGRRISKLGIPVYSLGLRRAMPNPLRVLSIIRLTRRLRPQLIQGWMPHGNLMASLAGVSSQVRVPVLWNIRMCVNDMAAEPLLTAATIRLGAFLSRHAAAIIYNSEIGARQHEKLGYHAARRVVIPNGFDCQMFGPDNEARRQVRAELGIGSDTILIGLIARFHPMKDHAGFLRAAGLVARAHRKVSFLFAGNGVTSAEPMLMERIAEQGLQGHTLLLDERPDIPRLTAALDIACSASAWGEGFSNSIGEAMACRKPLASLLRQVPSIGDTSGRQRGGA